MPDVLARVDVSSSPSQLLNERVRSFPSGDLVHAAAALFNRETVPERIGSFAPSLEFALRHGLGDRLDVVAPVGRRELVEGVRWSVEVAPGLVQVRSYDPARAERAAERAMRAHRINVDQAAGRLLAGEETPDHQPERGVTVWSSKSRSNMVRRLSTLDYEPMFADEGAAGLVTLTYPGEWLSVAPDSATCHAHLLAFRKRFERTYKRRLVTIWKREFQRRGAPHYHLFMVCPGMVNGETFREWTARVWSEIVGHADPLQCERHRLAGTAVDYAEGARFSDPRRLGVYFSKHGSFVAKDYQNNPPEEWTGSVGRFWGYWHLSPAVAVVEVAPDVARAVVRTARRWSDANSYRVKVWRWRKVTTVDAETGELGWKWRKRSTTVPVKRLRGAAGYLVVNDGPAFASALARASALAVGVRQGRGPVGYLP